MRVHELAKEIGVSSKELISELGKLGIKVKNHMSSLEADQVSKLKASRSSKKEVPFAKVPKAKSSQTIEKKKIEKKIEPPEKITPASPAVSAEKEKTVRIKGAMVVKDLADELGLKPNELIAELMGLNILASINQRIEANVAIKIAEKHGFNVEHKKTTSEHAKSFIPAAERDKEEDDKPEDLLPRAPVVTFMGHVDHGKTSLLDHIRKTSVVKGESGGITQHIGAYTVSLSGKEITFLDTPGHAAFTAMRARGANLTDIAVIVIAADDGMMPQTKEAITHARAAGVAIMVAVNKMDLPGANLDRVKQQLQEENLASEDWGGETICVPVSAQTGDGIEHLLEMILLQAEMLDLKANPNRRARGYVVEAQLKPGMGPVATLLVKMGTLKVGDVIVCEQCCGKARALINDKGIQLKSALPSTPVKCLGLSGVPTAGAEFMVLANERAGRLLVEERKQKQQADQAQTVKKASLDDLFRQMERTDSIELKLILKADTQGSVEAITHALKEIKSDKMTLSIILAAAGNITVNDVMLASASGAVIIGFHVAKETGVDSAARREGVDVRLHQIIYELTDMVRDAMTGMLKPELKEVVIGQAEVRKVFSIGKTGNIAGSYVLSGHIFDGSKARVKRGEEVLFEGLVITLKHFQDSVKEVKQGQECGIRLDKFSTFEEGDILEFYKIEEIAQTL